MLEKKETKIGLKPNQWLRAELLRRKEKNASYSVRAFSRDLGISQALLTWILNGQRHITLKQAQRIISILNLKPNDEKRFMDSVLFHLPDDSRLNSKYRAAKEKADSVLMPRSIAVEEFQMISQWHHLAILTLATTVGFKSDSVWIAKQLKITRIEVDSAIDRLLSLGLLKKEKSTLIPTSPHIKVNNDKSIPAIRAFHEKMIEKAKDELKKTEASDFEKRSISGITFSVPESDIPELKAYLETIKAEVVKRFSTASSDQVYQLNLQLFPLTKPRSEL